MDKNLSIALALGAGLLGGLITRYVAPPAAFAQNQAPIAKEIRAQSFTLVDPMDRAVGTFTFEPADIPQLSPQPAPGRSAPVRNGRIVLRDSSGRQIWTAGGNPIRELSVR